MTLTALIPVLFSINTSNIGLVVTLYNALAQFTVSRLSNRTVG